MNYPGIGGLTLTKDSTFRSVGNRESGNQLGFGFMQKPGVSVDEDKSNFSYYSCCYVIRGTGTYVDYLGRKYSLSPGSVFQRLPGRIHSTYIDPDSRWAECFIDFGINIYRDFLAAMAIINPETPVLQIEEDRAVEESIWSMLRELENSPESALPDLLLRALSFLRSLLAGDREPLNILENSCRDFTRDYRERIDLREYCRRKGLGYEWFRKSFRNFTGLSPGKYIIRRRIDMACHLLTLTDMPVKEIALELGYQSQYEFSAQFKSITGSSPRNYRIRRE